MPLKHSTETFLIAVLVVLIVLAGLVVRVLWMLGTSMLLWWAAPLIITLLYPLLLHPLLKSSRAEYSLRALHFAPFLIVLIGFLLSVGAAKLPFLVRLASFYAFGGSLAAVAFALFLLMRFCMAVLRQWNRRLGVLTALFIPFLAGGIAWEAWQGGALPGGLFAGNSSSVASSTAPVVAVTSSVNTSPSSHSTEELLRMQLRRMARRKDRLAAQSGAVSVVAAVRGVLAASTLSRQKPKPIAYDPDQLPASGFGIEPLALTMLAGYTALLHERARRRKTWYAAAYAA